MTEAEWLASADPRGMIEFLRGKASDRKLRLFAVAGCRAWPVETHPGGPGAIRRILEAAEGLADGTPGAAAAVQAALGVRRDDIGTGLASLEGPAEAAAREFAGASLHDRGGLIANLLREVVGNPFRVTRGEPALRTAELTSLAQAAYEERRLPSGELDSVRLCILADALEDAGAGEELLTHLRLPGPHVRGCWAVDLILGKS